MKSTETPKHLSALGNTDWYLWRWIVLRSAGFPTSHVLTLADTHCADLADQYIEQESIVRKELDTLVHLLWHKLPEVSDSLERAHIKKTIRQLKIGNTHIETVKLAQEVAAHFCSVRNRVNELKAEFQEAFQDVVIQNMQAIRMIANTSSFQEAILWQNRKVLHNEILPFLKDPLDLSQRSSRQRKRIAKIALYLHRYCMKNDTIGFFGPVGWAHLLDKETSISLQVGQNLLAERNIYFELWGIDTLAQALSQDEGILPWCSPRRLPLLDLTGLRLYVPHSTSAKLSPAEAFVLSKCDGEITAKQLAVMLCREPNNGLTTELDVYEILKSLKSMHRIAWRLEVSSENVYPEQALRRQLEKIEDDFLRKRSLETLNEIEVKRDAIARSRSDVEELDLAFSELEKTFTNLTGTASTRNPGQAYAGRTLLYEDCRRDVTLNIGPKLIGSLGPPLVLLLASARWFSSKVAAIYRKTLKQIYADLVKSAGTKVIDFASIWIQLQSFLFDGDTRILNALEHELQKRWLTIFKFTAEQHHVCYTSQEISKEVLGLFKAPRPGWKAACYHSPDLMIAANDLEAIQKGDFHWVLGELHVASNTINASVWLQQHPASEELINAMEVDLPLPQVWLVASREQISPRRAGAFYKPTDYRLVVANDSCGLSSSQTLLAGALVVEESNGELIVRTRDGGLNLEIIEFLGDVLSRLIIHRFNFIPPLRHTPRISVDRLVVNRETWRFAPKELTFAFEKNESERFIKARKWALIERLPRFLFVKTPTEDKPFFVDLVSPISIDSLAKLVRLAHDLNKQGALIEVTEMLPDPNQTWLIDKAGNKFTSEFRMVVVDNI